MHGFDVELSDPLPEDEIQVEDEEFIFKVVEDSFGNDIEKKEYELNKAPVKRIDEVTGTYNDGAVTFNAGQDYELSNDGERIVWQDDRTPDEDTFFYVSYTADSIISRFKEGGEEEMETIAHTFDDIIDSKFVDRAEGDELDQLGHLFGTLGRRRGRDDTDYRIYLKSIVQSLISRGTDSDIRQAVAASIGIDADQLEISEDLTNNEYDILVPPVTDHRSSTIEEIAEIADPSGVKLDKIRYIPAPDVVGVKDLSDATVSETYADQAGADDSVAIDPNVTTVADEASADDAVATTERQVNWGNDWGTMHWSV